MVFLGVKDQQACKTSMQKLSTALQGHIEKVEHKGVDVYIIVDSDTWESPLGYMLAGDFLVVGTLQRLSDIIDEAPPLVVSEDFAKASSQIDQPSDLLFYLNMGKAGREFLSPGQNAESEEDVKHLMQLGVIAAALVCDSQGVKIDLVGSPEKNWLETTGDLVDLLVQLLRNSFAAFGLLSSTD